MVEQTRKYGHIGIDAEAEGKIKYETLKRIIDVFASTVGLIILFPAFLVVAAGIKLESRGPVFFIQNRCGKNAKTFRMFKFRSMCEDAERRLEDLLKHNEMDGPVFKIKKDPRITRLGSFIRRTSIDELPQLINVLKGDMSLVGPRPPIVSEVEKYNSHQIKRLSVKPGLTCYWQVMGRNNISFNDWVELDLRYIRERNILLDLKLVFKTFFVLFGDRNAC